MIDKLIEILKLVQNRDDVKNVTKWQLQQAIKSIIIQAKE